MLKSNALKSEFQLLKDIDQETNNYLRVVQEEGRDGKPIPPANLAPSNGKPFEDDLISSIVEGQT